MSIDPGDLSDDVRSFLSEYHLASLTTFRPDGTPHVVAVGFSYSPADQTARIITWAASKKARNVAAAPGARAVVCQIDRGRWLSLEGTATVTDDPDRVAAAVDGYAARYRQPSERDDRVAIEIHVERILGRA
jgi:PPOX class probable F420-dependent enzyme